MLMLAGFGLGGIPGLATARQPVERFARLPAMQDVRLSPDGRQFAACLNHGDESILVTRAVQGGKASVLGRFDSLRHHLVWFGWAGDERLLVRVLHLEPRTRGDGEATVSRVLWSVAPDGSDQVQLPYDFTVFDIPRDGRHVLVNDGRWPAPGVHRLDIRTGRHSLVQAGRTEVESWMVDQAHRVRIGLRRNGATVKVICRDPDGEAWRTLWSFETMEGGEVWPLGFGPGANELYVTAQHEGRDAVFCVDLADPALAKRLVASDPRWDVRGSLMLSPLDGRVLGVRSASMGDSGMLVWDPDLKALLARIDRGLPERANRLLQWSADGRRYLLHSSGNATPGEYFIGDVQSGELALLAQEYPDLDAGQLVRKQASVISARDGLKLTVFVTLPKDAEPGAALPTVLLPHGGPQSSDDADIDLLPQFLADRGYAVLQVNFRGSDGRGHAFRAAGFGQWGKAMQDDLTDAVQWLIAEGVADAQRLAIVGGSYGGYAALMGVATTPRLYRCAVSLAGVSDLGAMGRRAHLFSDSPTWLDKQLGSPFIGGPDLDAISPRYLADRIRVPVLLIHGTMDGIVPFEQGQWMADALRSAGKPFRFIRQEFAGHALAHQPYRLQYFRELESFLAENMAAR